MLDEKYEGSVLSNLQRDTIDVAIPQLAKRVLLVDEDGNYYTDDNRLPVNASLVVEDIQIGAVELKDGDSNTRVDVETVGSYNAVLSQDVVEFQKQKVNNFGSASVAPGATVTLVTLTVPATKRFVYRGGIVGGNDHGKFEFQINSITQATVRNSGSNPTIQVTFIEPPEASTGSVVDLNVTNNSNKTKSFEATLSGYII